jgi:hypothetical protein
VDWRFTGRHNPLSHTQLSCSGDSEIELEKWYFATLWSGEFGPLVAFTVDGEVNILIEDGVEPRPTKPGQNRGKVSTITY